MSRETEHAEKAWTTFVSSFDSRETADALVARLKAASGFVPSSLKSVEGSELPPGFVWRKRDGVWIADDVRARSETLLAHLEARGIVPGKKLTGALARYAADLLLESEGFRLDRWERFVHPDHPGLVIRVKEKNLREEQGGRMVSSVSVIDWVTRRLQILSNRALREDVGRRAKAVRQAKTQQKKKAATRKVTKALRTAAQHRLTKLLMKRIVDEELGERITLSGTGFEGDPEAYAQILAMMHEIESSLDAEIVDPTPESEIASWFTTARPPWPFRFPSDPYRWDESGRTVSIERIPGSAGEPANSLEVRIGGTKGFLAPRLGMSDEVTALRPIDLDRQGDGYLVTRVLPAGYDRPRREGLRLIPAESRSSLAIVTFMDTPDSVSAELLVRLLSAWRIEGILVTDRLVAALLVKAGTRIASPVEAEAMKAGLADRVIGVEPWVPYQSIALVLPD